MLLYCLLLYCLLCAVLGAAQKDLLDEGKREELWKALEMARGERTLQLLSRL